MSPRNSDLGDARSDGNASDWSFEPSPRLLQQSGSHSGNSSDSEDSAIERGSDRLQFLYEKYKEYGSQRRRWIEDPNEPGCFVTPTTVDFEGLVAMYQLHWPVRTITVNGILDHATIGLDPSVGYLQFGYACESFTWWGYTTPGTLIIEGVSRRDLEGHQMSEVSHAVYARDHDINSLKHIYVNLVQNSETWPLVQHRLYSQANNLTWPDSGDQVWDVTRSVDDFDALLGTRIGKLVAYIVLGAFPRGTRRIARIVTVPSAGDTAVHLRFDIEDMA